MLKCRYGITSQKQRVIPCSGIDGLKHKNLHDPKTSWLPVSGHFHFSSYFVTSVVLLPYSFSDRVDLSKIEYPNS